MTLKEIQADYRKHVLALAGRTFLSKLNLIKWEAAQWMQYRGCYYDEAYSHMVFKFKSSTYGIGFEVSVRIFPEIKGGVPEFLFHEVYDHFKKIKYEEYGKMDNTI